MSPVTVLEALPNMFPPSLFGSSLHTATVAIAVLGLVHPMFLARCFGSKTKRLLILAYFVFNAVLLIGVLKEDRYMISMWVWYSLIFSTFMLVIMLLNLHIYKDQYYNTILSVLEILSYLLTIFFALVVNTYRKENATEKSTSSYYYPYSYDGLNPYADDRSPSSDNIIPNTDVTSPGTVDKSSSDDIMPQISYDITLSMDDTTSSRNKNISRVKSGLGTDWTSNKSPSVDWITRTDDIRQTTNGLVSNTGYINTNTNDKSPSANWTTSTNDIRKTTDNTISNTGYIKKDTDFRHYVTDCTSKTDDIAQSVFDKIGRLINF